MIIQDDKITLQQNHNSTIRPMPFKCIGMGHEVFGKIVEEAQHVFYVLKFRVIDVVYFFFFCDPLIIKFLSFLKDYRFVVYFIFFLRDFTSHIGSLPQLSVSILILYTLLPIHYSKLF